MDYLGVGGVPQKEEIRTNFTNLMNFKEDYEHLKAVLRCDENTWITR